MAEVELQVEWNEKITLPDLLPYSAVVPQSSVSSSSYSEQCSVYGDSLVSDYWELMGERFHRCTHAIHTNSVPHILTFSKMSSVCKGRCTVLEPTNL